MTATETTSRPTLAAIAQQASVSLATVSKVLNGRPGVSSATRAIVEDLLAASGYARRGKPAEAGSVVELVVGSLDTEWSIEIIRGVERVAREHGYALTLSNMRDHHEVADDWVSGVLRRRPAAVVLQFSNLTAAHREQLRTRGIPFAVVDPAGDPPPDVPSVGATNWAGGMSATKHLLDLGHTRIAAIAGPLDMLCASARLAGYRSALVGAGVTVDERLVADGEFEREVGERSALRLLAEDPRPTAIVAANDLQALGVYDAAQALGLRVPEDLSVVGFDDVAPARWARPALTTVRQPLQEMAEQATRLALRLQDAPGRMPQIELATTLEVRGSTAAPSRKFSNQRK
uniref:LacI family DNA-binding transcriptional regulator n=1 Tax=Neobacillus citreus TaxID=2833578 RepID=A0A942SY75_9BACI